MHNRSIRLNHNTAPCPDKLFVRPKISRYNEHMSTENSIVSIDPEVLSGTPVFRGTRVPIKNLFDCLAADESLSQFLEGFPSVSREAVLTLFKELHEDAVGSKKAA